MATKEELKKEIQKEYDWYNLDHHQKPNVAYVKCLWYNDEEPEDVIQTIALDEEWYNSLEAENGGDYVVPYINDEDVLYYCSGINDLLHLVDDEPAADFRVVEFIGFERLKTEKDN